MDAVKVIRVALSVLTDRLLVLMGMAMACFLAGWVMWEPAWERVAALAIFAVFGYFFVPKRESKNDVHDS